MQGALLRSGKNDEFIALGETGQPVYKAALQIISALARKSPDLALFLAIPKSNEQGDAIDWYSPLPGDVIPWHSATEEEREEARIQLQGFTQAIAEMSRKLVENGEKTHQGDLQIFGKLLGLVSHSPVDDCLYLVQGTRRSEDSQAQPRLQPVLSFWGFIRHDADRHRDPLYFLTPRVPSPVTPPETTPLAEPTAVTQPVVQPIQPPPLPTPTVVRPWWRRFWWLWPLLLLLALLLLLSLLRGCVPGVSLPWGTPTVPDTAWHGSSPNVNLHGTQLSGSEPTLDEASSTATRAEQTATPETPSDTPEASTPNGPTEPPAPPAEDNPTTEAPAQLPTDTETNAANAPVAPPQLSIPPQAPEGPADFLNGNYRAGAGIIDATTAKPLRLEYAFEKGKGNVTIQRPDGTSCTGAVSATMQGGQLGINSDDQATCSDGGSYDMPQVSCAPGAQSIADCTGSYGQTQFPMIMRRQ